MAGLNGISTLGHNVGTASVNSTSAAETQAASAKAAGTRGPETTSGVVADQAKVSSTGGLVAQALSTSDVRQDKVSQLQAAIASGTYSVSSADVASKIVDSLLR